MNLPTETMSLESEVTPASVTSGGVGSSALLAACFFISEKTGDCPQGVFDVEPHDIPCADVCFEFTNKTHECWKRHFLNLANASGEPRPRERSSITIQPLEL
jgi:hypothetical protein